ncbi:hypothetical protein Tsubulata_013566 [Turnera subulata]|uniref:TSL-kinase interacting protein 1 n=1 Tax=Turnera subulata TaxID=218843 RepID=A0A9Q0EZE1_9ROSI|nr:hypothetical protein Tsubulata_013566 [Turnera subulata]
MISPKKRAAKAVGAPKRPKLGSGLGQPQCLKPKGKREDFPVEKENTNFDLVSGSMEALSSHPTKRSQFCSDMAKKLSLPERCPDQILQPSGKIKLQLFPMDKSIQAGLEKDGYNPYLELTLNARKKISSVLKHLDAKWAGSRIALGDPILLPYNTSKDVTGRRWTLSDTDVSAGDVYRAMGCPSVFRLWYGWFSNSDSKSHGFPSTSTASGTCLKSEGLQNVCSADTASTYNEGKQIVQAGEELRPSISKGATDVAADDKMPYNRLVKPLGNEVRVGQPSTLWDDNLTSISIGGLLSEASLQGRFNNDPKLNGSNIVLQQSQSQIVSDSLDAFLSTKMSGTQCPNPPPQGLSSSILDAEDTCHAFLIQKFSVSGKDAEKLGGSANSRICRPVSGSAPFKFPRTTKVHVKSSFAQGLGSQESQPDPSLCPPVYNDENSLGLSGIKWTDSRGPFDLGISSSRKILNGDSLSMSGIVS